MRSGYSRLIQDDSSGEYKRAPVYKLDIDTCPFKTLSAQLKHPGIINQARSTMPCSPYNRTNGGLLSCEPSSPVWSLHPRPFESVKKEKKGENIQHKKPKSIDSQSTVYTLSRTECMKMHQDAAPVKSKLPCGLVLFVACLLRVQLRNRRISQIRMLFQKIHPALQELITGFPRYHQYMHNNIRRRSELTATSRNHQSRPTSV